MSNTTRFCKHISFDEIERKFLVREPAILKPVHDASGEVNGMKCSRCKTKVPILYMRENRIRIKLIPRNAV